jgi:hypothetical protein
MAMRLTSVMRRRPDDGRSGLGRILLAGLWIFALAAAWTLQPPYRAPTAPALILWDLEPPGAEPVQIDYASRPAR